MDIRFKVAGTPQSKGNMSGIPRVRGPCQKCKPVRPCGRRSCVNGWQLGVAVTDKGGKALEAWQDLVTVEAISARNRSGARPIAKPDACEVSMVFVLPRPANHFLPDGRLSSEGRVMVLPVVKPDTDKLARSCFDSLTRSLVVDDAVIKVAHLSCVYATWKGWTGVVIHARQVHEVPEWARQELAFAGVTI